MSEETKIEWCDYTWSPWEGCTKVSEGCKHCYAETRNHRFGNDNWGKGKSRRLTAESGWKKPLAWQRFEISSGTAHHGGIPPRVFPSLCDWLDDEVPIEWLARFLKLIHDTPNIDWLLLTKRPENFSTRLRAVLNMETFDEDDFMKTWMVKMNGQPGWALHLFAWLQIEPTMKVEPFENVWFGVSVENQAQADERIPKLLDIPAKVKWLSVEPMLEAVDLKFHAFTAMATEQRPCGGREVTDNPTVVKYGPVIDWAVFGGESGPGARPCNIEWIRDGMAQCAAAGVPVFIKQIGSDSRHNTTGEMVPISGPLTGKANVKIVNSPLRLKHSKGGDPSEWPEDLRVREWPIANRR